VTRNPLASTNSGSKISLSGSATISIDIIAQDLAAFALAANTPLLLGTTNVTSAAYITDATSLGTSGFESFTVKLTNLVPASNGTTLGAQFYANGAWQTSSYEYTLNGCSSGGMGTNNNYSSTYICLTYPGTFGASGNFLGRNANFDVANPAGTGTTVFGMCGGYASDASGPQVIAFAGCLNTAYPVTGIRIFASSGNITGTMKIYGNP
jgi:hypothetical protein